MSRSLPEWIGATDDTPVPPRVRLRVFQRAGGSCQGTCGNRRLMPGDHWECDHTIALVNGGQNRESNLSVKCEWCHPAKTASDVAEKSATYKRALRHAGVRKPRSITRWRKFSGEIVTAPRER